MIITLEGGKEVFIPDNNQVLFDKPFHGWMMVREVNASTGEYDGGQVWWFNSGFVAAIGPALNYEVPFPDTTGTY